MGRPSAGAAEWAARIDQWRESGLSLPAFCQRHGLSRGTMQNWVYKPALRRAVEDVGRAAQTPRDVPAVTAEVPTQPPAFLPVRLAGVINPSAEPGSRSAIEVVLGEGRRVAVGPGFDPETLRRVVAALGG
jgi:hypothetical protein